MAIVAKILIILLTLFVLTTCAVLLLSHNAVNNNQIIYPVNNPSPTITESPTIPIKYIIPMKKHVIQTFNNCGPASLSMLLSYFDIEVTQQVLGQKLRPWQNPQGINDDKNVFLSEISDTATEFNLSSYHRRDGDLEILKKLISNNITVLVRTYLHPGEDIGHFRIIRGYDDETSTVTQDDSFEGKNIIYSYEEFTEMWKPFNFEYVVFYKNNQINIVNSILGEEIDEQIAWLNAKKQTEQNLINNPDDIIANFNLSVIYYHLKDYKKSVNAFEKVENRLSNRTLWYQIEPIQSYLILNNFDRVFNLTDKILTNNNLAFSELYILRAEAYRRIGNIEMATLEIDKAINYNSSLLSAKIAKENLILNKPLFP